VIEGNFGSVGITVLAASNQIFGLVYGRTASTITAVVVKR
jgi:hypothetical protein